MSIVKVYYGFIFYHEAEIGKVEFRSFLQIFRIPSIRKSF